MGVAWHFFSPLRATNSYITHYNVYPVINFQLNTLKGTQQMRLNTLRGIKTEFLTPKGYDKHPYHFIWEFQPPGPHFRSLDIFNPSKVGPVSGIISANNFLLRLHIRYAKSSKLVTLNLVHNAGFHPLHN